MWFEWLKIALATALLVACLRPRTLRDPSEHWLRMARRKREVESARAVVRWMQDSRVRT